MNVCVCVCVCRSVQERVKVNVFNHCHWYDHCLDPFPPPHSMMRFAECFHYWGCCCIQQHKGHSITPGVSGFVIHMLKFNVTSVLMPFNQKHWWVYVVQIFNA